MKASLLEEGAPIDTEVRREAEVIRQVREGEAQSDINLPPVAQSQPTTSCSSPTFAPLAPVTTDNTNSIPDDISLDSRRSSSAFTSPSDQALRWCPLLEQLRRAHAHPTTPSLSTKQLRRYQRRHEHRQQGQQHFAPPTTLRTIHDSPAAKPTTKQWLHPPPRSHPNPRPPNAHRHRLRYSPQGKGQQ